MDQLGAAELAWKDRGSSGEQTEGRHPANCLQAPGSQRPTAAAQSGPDYNSGKHIVGRGALIRIMHRQGYQSSIMSHSNIAKVMVPLVTKD